jgi:hypothetical protein
LKKYHSEIHNFTFPGIDSCPLKELETLKKIGYTHEYAKENTKSILVGSFVDVYCEDETTRIEYDKYDNDPWDYKMSFVCEPLKRFNLPIYDWNKPVRLTYPSCFGWCPRVKPLPPNATGMYLSFTDRNFRYRDLVIQQMI